MQAYCWFFFHPTAATNATYPEKHIICGSGGMVKTQHCKTLCQKSHNLLHNYYAYSTHTRLIERDTLDMDLSYLEAWRLRIATYITHRCSKDLNSCSFNDKLDYSKHIAPFPGSVIALRQSCHLTEKVNNTFKNVVIFLWVCLFISHKIKAL